MDAETIGVYDAHHEDYASRFGDQGPSESLQAFAGGLSAGQRVLDLGCGPGNAARTMASMGLTVTALDASEGMIARVRGIEGVEAVHTDFFWLDQHRAAFHGIWANFSLLHAAEDELDLHLDAIRAALLPPGRLHLGMKTGSGTKRDHLGRRYAYFGRDDLLARLELRGFRILNVHEGEEVGLAGSPDPFILILAELGPGSEAV
ncbi:MAG: class I SAM-dependent methyltransferase [Pseudomonadota bacterium]|nr:class I SAM-dependent methyltransferase [Pseudomonadota bacterium]